MKRLPVLFFFVAGLILMAMPAWSRPLDVEQRQVSRLVTTCRLILSQLEGEIGALDREMDEIALLESQKPRATDDASRLIGVATLKATITSMTPRTWSMAFRSRP